MTVTSMPFSLDAPSRVDGSAERAAQTRRVVVRAGPIHVTELGPATGVPLVFLHGVLASAALWSKVAAELANGPFAGHRCLLLELPLGAHPEPMNVDAELSPPAVADAVIEVLDRLGIPEAILVGNDSGGALCQLLIAAHPARLVAVVLTSSDAYGVWLPPLFKPFELAAFVPGLLFVISQLLRLPRLRRSRWVFGWLSRHLSERESAALVERIANAGWARRDLAKFLRGISGRLTLRAAEHFASFRRPVLVLWSAEDRFFSRSLAERLVRDLPRSRLELVPGAYTFSPVDAPELVAEAIAKFVREIA